MSDTKEKFYITTAIAYVNAPLAVFARALVRPSASWRMTDSSASLFAFRNPRFPTPRLHVGAAFRHGKTTVFPTPFVAVHLAL